MNNHLRQALAASLLVLALAFSSFAGEIQYGQSGQTQTAGDMQFGATAGDMQFGVTAGDMDNGATANGIIHTGITGASLEAMLRLLGHALPLF